MFQGVPGIATDGLGSVSQRRSSTPGPRWRTHTEVHAWGTRFPRPRHDADLPILSTLCANALSLRYVHRVLPVEGPERFSVVWGVA